MRKRSMVVGVENRSGWVEKRKMMYRARDEVETMTRATELAHVMVTWVFPHTTDPRALKCYSLPLEVSFRPFASIYPSFVEGSLV